MGEGASSRRSARRGFHPAPARKRAEGTERDAWSRSGSRDRDAVPAGHGEDAATQPDFGPPRDERAG